MPGFTSNDQIISALTSGKTRRIDWTKNFNPTAAAVANECHTLFRGNGNPPPDALFNTGTNLAFQPVSETTANAGTIQHGGNVSPDYKFLLNGSAVTAAATTVPCNFVLIDVIGFYRVTTVTTTTAQATTNPLSPFSTFTVDPETDVVTHTNINLMPFTRVQLTTTGTLPGGLSLATNYFVIRLTDFTCKFATSYANAVAGISVDITSAGSGTHTINTLYPRYTNGAGLNAFFFNSNATALGAATPNLSLGYTNAAQVGSRATPPVLPIGKSGATNSHIIYTGATGAGKYNFAVPLQSGDTGIAQIDTIRNDVSYVSGEYSVAVYKEMARFPISTLGLAAERNFLYEMPSLPRIYDGAALYFVIISGAATPANSSFSGHLDIVWG